MHPNQRAFYVDPWFLHHMSVNHSYFDIFMPQKLLYCSNIASQFQYMSLKTGGCWTLLACEKQGAKCLLLVNQQKNFNRILDRIDENYYRN